MLEREALALLLLGEHALGLTRRVVEPGEVRSRAARALASGGERRRHSANVGEQVSELLLVAADRPVEGFEGCLEAAGLLDEFLAARDSELLVLGRERFRRLDHLRH